MGNNLDLNALIRCLEVMADENSWVNDNYGWLLVDPIEARPWEVARGALAYVNAIRLANEDRFMSHGYVVDPSLKDNSE